MKYQGKTKAELIVELKRLQKENQLLNNSSEQYKLIFENSPLGLLSFDKSGEIITCNDIFINIIGSSKDNLIGLNMVNLPDKKLVEAVHNALSGSLGFYQGDYQSFTAPKTTPVRVLFSPLYENGIVNGGVGIIEDISERVRHEKLIKESEENLSITLNSIGDGVISTDRNGLVERMNPVAEQLCGWTLEQAAGKPLTEIFKIYNSDTGERVKDPVKKVLEIGKVIGLANHTVLRSGSGVEYQIADSAAPIISSDGNINGVVLVFSDVTEKYQFQKQLSESAQKFQALFMNMIDGCALHEIIYDQENNPEDYVIIEINPAFETLLGISREQVLGKTSREAYSVSEPPYLDIYSKVALSGEPISFETYFHPLSKHFSISVYSPYKGSFATIFEDTTARHNSEAALKTSEGRLYALLQNIPDLIWLKDSEGVYLACNSVFERFFGARESEILGKSDYDFVEPEIADMFRKNDNIAMAAGKPTVNEEWITFADDGHKALLETIKTPMCDKDGTLIGVLGIGRDITERYYAEKELLKAKEKTEESERLKSAFLANMSHEIRTPLNGILGFAEMLREPNLSGEEVYEYVRTIEQGGKRMLNIINDLVVISKLETGIMDLHLSISNINEQIDFVCNIFKPEAQQKNLEMVVKKQLPDDQAVIRTDREKIYGVLTNLVKNAIKFTNEGSIQIGYEIKGDFLEIFVKDTGTGIVPEIKEVIFERFRQGSENINRKYEGAGLGLSISKAYVEMLGGKLWVESQEGKGSSFYFTIPYNWKYKG